MTQIDPEVTTTTPTPPLDINPEGAPTVAENENMSNATATADAVALEEELTSGAAADAAVEETLETSADVKAATSKDATDIGELDPEVANAGITSVGEHLDASQTAKAVGDSGIAEATMVGELYPPDHIKGDKVTLAATQPTTISEFNALASNKFAKGDGGVYQQAVEHRWKILNHLPKLPKIFGGKKIATEQPANNIIAFPNQQAEKKAAA